MATVPTSIRFPPRFPLILSSSVQAPGPAPAAIRSTVEMNLWRAADSESCHQCSRRTTPTRLRVQAGVQVA